MTVPADAGTGPAVRIVPLSAVLDRDAAVVAVLARGGLAADSVYTLDVESSSAVVAQLVNTLAARRWTVGSAESCTGGGFAAALTAVPGASAVFWGSIVAYANDAKTTLLAVDADVVLHCGAVSREVADRMAVGLLQRSPVDTAVAITGIAGPGGAVAGKPVGLVWIAVHRRDGRAQTLPFWFGGDRAAVRSAAVVAAVVLANRVCSHGFVDSIAQGPDA